MNKSNHWILYYVDVTPGYWVSELLSDQLRELLEWLFATN